jgi:predicted nucleotidyltransferase component of viral defense system
MTTHNSIHRSVLLKILKDIFTDPTLAPYLAFKGGTAAMLFYGLPRFSIDLDFDLLDLMQEEYVFSRIKEILEKYGTVKRADKKRFSLFYLLSFDGKRDNAYNIKVDVNKREFGAKYQILSSLGLAVRVMKQDDMAAHKMMAMYDRLGNANRDIYDVWYFLDNNWPINKKNIENRMGMDYKAFLKKSIDALEKFDDRQILSGLGELLDEKQKAWVKAHLKSETLFLLRLALSNEEA